MRSSGSVSSRPSGGCHPASSPPATRPASDQLTRGSGPRRAAANRASSGGPEDEGRVRCVFRLPANERFKPSCRSRLAQRDRPPGIGLPYVVIGDYTCEHKGTDVRVRRAARRLPRRGTRPQLLPIPAIGFLTACVVLAEIGESGRFRSANQLCSWAGLTDEESPTPHAIRPGKCLPNASGSFDLRWMAVTRAFEVRISKRTSTACPPHLPNHVAAKPFFSEAGFRYQSRDP